MSKHEQEDDTGSPSLQDLLEASRQVERNVNAENEAIEKQNAMLVHGLVEPGQTTRKKSGASEAEVSVLNSQLDDLREQLETVTSERDQLRSDLADRDNSLADRDDQIKRLGQQLETLSEANVVRADTVLSTTTKPVDEANQSAEEAPKIVHPTGEPAKVVKAKAVPKVPTGAKETESAPAVKQPWDAS